MKNVFHTLHLYAASWRYSFMLGTFMVSQIYTVGCVSFLQIIASIAFGLLSIGVCAAVGVISYEAIDWDLDDYGDGDGKVN